MDYRFWSAALRPVGPNDAVPPTLASTPRDPARLNAVGPWVDPNVTLVNRLAAVRGVLRYDEGRVIDVATGKEMLPH
jgi:hypothetical protein